MSWASRLAKIGFGLAVLGLLLVPLVFPVDAQAGTRVTTTTRAPERCMCMMDLSTGSIDFTAKPAGSRENPVTTPLDWVVRLPDRTLDRPWVVNPVPGAWHSGPPVGSRAMWINPYRPENNLPPSTAPANTNFTYSIVFTAPSPGRIYLRGGSDDPGWIYLNGVYTGVNIPGYALWPSQPGWWVITVSAGINNLTAVVTNIPGNSPTGLLVEAFYCSDEAPPATTVTVTTTTRVPGTTETRTVTTTATTSLPATTVTTRINQTTTETRTETVVSPTTATVVSATTKEVPTTVISATTVKEPTTTTQTVEQVVRVTTTFLSVVGEIDGDDLFQISPLAGAIIGGLAITVAAMGAYLVIKTKSSPR
ncbi:MAG: hypothetical protein RMI43_06585 [Candidatus Caldarchaeum sp.]|nr:hypothetical protein [Candidatus Caldarchaeum sp.]MCS7133317.1 hypothetical protein [Candidatus Caldarchaeum sp.]MDW8063820.1 hypothetical protein [Candidatus Caldarchaeum sp.]MDW8435865.1 hypothetical protein [Candidatus Caldarchaeum sp.]